MSNLYWTDDGYGLHNQQQTRQQTTEQQRDS